MREDQTKAQKTGGVFLILQLMNMIYSLNSVLIKITSMSWENCGFFDKHTLGLLLLALLVLAIYAVLWQMMLSRVELSIAYLSKGMVVFWGLLWSVVIFEERISIPNFLGTVMIFTGTVLVMRNEQ